MTFHLRFTNNEGKVYGEGNYSNVFQLYVAEKTFFLQDEVTTYREFGSDIEMLCRQKNDDVVMTVDDDKTYNGLEEILLALASIILQQYE